MKSKRSIYYYATKLAQIQYIKLINGINMFLETLLTDHFRRSKSIPTLNSVTLSSTVPPQ